MARLTTTAMLAVLMVMSGCAESGSPPSSSSAEDASPFVEETVLENAESTAKESKEAAAFLRDTMCADSPKFVAKVAGVKSERPQDIAAAIAETQSSLYGFDYDLLYKACLEGFGAGRPQPSGGASQPACQESDNIGQGMNNKEILSTLQRAYAKAGQASTGVREAIARAVEVFSGAQSGDVTRALIDIGHACTDAQIQEDWG